MAVPRDIAVIDTMMGLPGGNKRWWVDSMRALLLDAESQEQFTHAAGYMFKDPVDPTRIVDPIGDTLRGMDTHNIDKALITVGDDLSLTAIAHHPDRFLGQVFVDPNDGMDAVRLIGRAVDVNAAGQLIVEPGDGSSPVPIAAGDVTHLRPLYR